MHPQTTKRRVLRFGVFELDPETQELRKRGVKFKFAGQSFHALFLLLDRSPSAVTREELCQKLWPDEPWGDHDHRLNKTINRIREVLGDSADSPRFLETLPRVGYRFLVPVERGPDPAVGFSTQPLLAASPAIVPATEGARWSSKHWVGTWLIALCLACALSASLAYRFERPRAERLPAASEAIPLTSFLGTELEPSFSPDGTQVAFTWNGEAQGESHVYVMPLSGGAPRQIGGGKQKEYGPVWAPDGKKIAFLRTQGQDTAELRVFDLNRKTESLVTTIGVNGTGHPLSWMPDSIWLAASCRVQGDGPSSLYLISSKTGERKRLTSPAVQFGGDFGPAISPDGRSLGFVRWTNSSWQDVFVLALSGDMVPVQDPRRLTNLKRIVDTVAWTADGKEIFFSSARSLAGARFLFRVNVSSSVRGSPVDTGIEGIDPAVSADGSSMAYARQNLEQTSIWRLKAGSSGQSKVTTAARLLSSTRRDFTADISPDGHQLVFSSARTGTTDIWICDLDGGNLKRITSFGASTPRWSPDGKKIVFESTRDGQSEIYWIDIQTNAIHRLTSDPAADVRPSWSRDGKFVYFSSNRTGKHQIWKVAVNSGDPIQITHGSGAYGIETPDGRFLYYLTADQPAAIRFVPVTGGEERQIVESVVGYSSLAMSTDGLYYLASLTPTDAELDVVDLVTRSRRRALSIDRPVHHFLSSPPDGRSILYTTIDREDSDLMLLKLPKN